MSLITLCFILTFVISWAKCEKSTLAFAIDDTASMGDDIDAVKNGANRILEIALSKKSSLIKNFVLVAINDPDVVVKAATTDANQFKRAINALQPWNYGQNKEWDEPSMQGTQLALENSLPGSEIYVFTDAAAKDHYKSNIVMNLCQKKQSRVIFVLTGNCCSQLGINAFYDVAAACSGDVYKVDKSQIPAILKSIEDDIKGPKTSIVTKKITPNTWTNIDFTVDDQTEYVVISVSGDNVQIELTGDNDSVTKAIRTTWLPNVKIEKMVNPKPGRYRVRVLSTSIATVTAYARSDFTFLHGFSELKPKGLKFTTAQPIKGVRSHLSVDITDPQNNIKIKSAQILDMDDRVIKEIPLNRVQGNFYTTDSQLWPEHRFKVAIIGIGPNGNTLRRLAKTPVEPQKPKEPERRSPVVTIAEGEKTSVEYDGSLTLTCAVNAYPPPTIVWKDSKGNTLPSKSSTLEPPFKYISYLWLNNVVNPDKYTCSALSGNANVGKAIDVTVNNPFTVNNNEHIGGVTQIEYGKKSVLKCKIRSKLPIQIIWKSYNKQTSKWETLKTDGKLTISSDGTELIINSMDLDMEGHYSCESALKTNGLKGPSFNTQVKITGVSKPKLEKTSSILKVTENEVVTISCRTAGIPKPNVQLQFKSTGSKDYVNIPLSNEMLQKKALLSDAGYYKCIAQNALGTDEQIHKLIVQAPPTITTKKSEYFAVEQDLVLKLPCETRGFPKPSISWMMNGNDITSGKKYTITDEHLNIVKPVMKDSNKYTCTATNTFGVAKKDYTVDVQQYLDGSTFGNTSDVFKLEDHLVKLNCRLPTTDPSKVRWYYNGLLMKETGLTLTFEKATRFNDGNYTCRANSDNGSLSETYVLDVGYPPTSKSEINGVKQINWNGQDQSLSCDVEAKPQADAKWLYNGKKVGDGSLLLKVLGWGHYTCQVTNVHGSIQVNFSVSSKDCIIQTQPTLNNLPLILTDTSTWPDFGETPGLLQIQHGQSLQISCDSNKNNNLQIFKKNIKAICDREDKFLVDGKDYKFSDLKCDAEVLPIIKETQDSCLTNKAKKVSVGFNTVEPKNVYEVCFDKTNNVPLYTHRLTSFNNPGYTINSNWYNNNKVSGAVSGFDKSYNCSKSTKSCCYDKKQLVNAQQVTYGPAQRATFINELNAVPVWIPCQQNNDNNNWNKIENIVSEFSRFEPVDLWSGVSELITLNGNLIPRYLWKVIDLQGEYLTIVYVNTPVPTAKDIRCKNICDDYDNKILSSLGKEKNIYCCQTEEFMKAFNLPENMFKVDK